jgi:hypothetical protein
MENDGGEFVYADALPNGEVYPSSDLVGKVSPKAKGKKKGIHNSFGRDCTKKLCGGVQAPPIILRDEEGGGGRKGKKGGLRDLSDVAPEQHSRRTIATTGTLKNLVVLLYFKDHKKKKRKIPSIEDIDVLMNNMDTPYHELAPTGSLKKVYREISYGQLTIESTIVPWVVTNENEDWYADGDSG